MSTPARAALRARWTTWWTAQPLRVQGLLLVAAIVGAGGLIDAIAIAPASAEARRIAQRASIAQREIDAQSRLAEQVAVEARAAQTRLAAQREELARLDAAVRAARERTVAPGEVADRLARLMPRSGPLRATGLGSQAPQPLDGGDLWRHPFEVRLEGDWPALVAHVRAMEGQLAAVRWRAVEFQADAWPTVTGRLEVFTIGTQPVWIRL